MRTRSLGPDGAGGSTTSRPTSAIRDGAARGGAPARDRRRARDRGELRALLLGAAGRHSRARRADRQPAGSPASGWTRLIVEKPFGHDRESARALNAQLSQYFVEEEIFRIDHYLGKETVQNMLALRFANGIFEPIWNRQFVDHVQITVAESIGIEGRAGFYEDVGSDPRRLPEPPPAARRADGDGAACRLHRRLGAQREGQGAAGMPDAGPGQRRPRPVRARLRRGRRGARLPRGAGGPANR